MARTTRARGALICLGLIAAGCTNTGGVELTESNQHAPDSTPSSTSSTLPTDSTTPGTTPDSTTSGTTTPGTAPLGDDLPSIEPADWQDCVDQAAPWQSATITVPLDYNDPTGKQIFIALVRLPARSSSDRIGSLVINPGGPGGSGLQLAAMEAENFPDAILDRFDIVGFDPRGVGESTAAHCPDDLDSTMEGFDRCITDSADLLPYLGTPNAARDLEQIRKAVGDDALTYLGYSYGTALGAVYADMFPDRVRALVLDGSIDPVAGRVNATHDFGDDYYAQQDFQGTTDVFHQLCDASVKCAIGPHSKEVLKRVERTVRDLPTSYFDLGFTLAGYDVDDIVVNSMYSVAYWQALAVALKDADDGDASTLAALYSWLQHGYPADTEAEPDYEFAHLAIQCADFAGRGSQTYECGGFPDSADPLPEIVATDASSPILVVGTKDDPATPARYSVAMARALGDAVSIQWDGAGHTAFLSSKCVTEVVTDYIVDVVVPADGLSCPFVVGASTQSEQADAIFGAGSYDVDGLTQSLVDVLVANGTSTELAECVASHLVARGDQRLIVHQELGVESPDLVTLRGTLERACERAG